MTDIKALRLSEIASYEDELKDKLFHYASEHVRYEHVAKHGLIAPCIELLFATATIFANTYIFGDLDHKAAVTPILITYAPYFFNSLALVYFCSALFKFIKYKPYQLPSRKRGLLHMITYFGKHHGLNVTSVTPRDLWFELISQSANNDEVIETTFEA
jgi:hypothetical protein